MLAPQMLELRRLEPRMLVLKMLEQQMPFLFVHSH
jgi:hypothetical protein